MVSQDRLNIQAQAQAASDNVNPIPYTPYTQFRPCYFGMQNMSNLPLPSFHLTQVSTLADPQCVHLTKSQVPSGEETNNSMDDAPPSALHSTEVITSIAFFSQCPHFIEGISTIFFHIKLSSSCQQCK